MNQALPTSLIKSLNSLKGFDEEAFTRIHDIASSITSIRINPFKIMDNKQLQHLSFENPVPWNSYGYYLSARPSFTFDPCFHAGAYYVQEASSMFIAHIANHIKQMDNRKEWKILDACAAPGGKTTLLADAFPQSFIIANEVIASRVNVLIDNVVKWGSPYVIVTQNDPVHFTRLNGFFNFMLVDAPCSGSGLFRKHPEATAEWSSNNVKLCSERQERILHNLISSLTQDGYLIYSTCSYSIEENEHIVDKLMGTNMFESVCIPIENSWGIEEVYTQQKAYCYRFWPYKLQGEGFFVACFKKKRPPLVPPKGEERKKLHNNAFLSIINKWFKPIEEMVYHQHKENIYAIPKNSMNDYLLLNKHLYIKRAGIHIGKMIRDEIIPEHDLAMSTLIADDVVKVELDYATAIQFVRKENIEVHIPHKGWALACYNAFPLGWMKILPNRINNYYPLSLKIINKQIRNN